MSGYEKSQKSPSRSLKASLEIQALEAQVESLKKKAGLTEVDQLKAKLLSFTKSKTGEGSWTLLELARKLDAKIPTLEEAIAQLKKESYDINVQEGVVHRLHEAPPGQSTSHYWRLKEGGWLRFGALGDNQLGNRHARIDAVVTAYEDFKKEGIDTVYHTGNMIDGYHPRFNAFELLPEAGTSMESQVSYAGRVYPKVPGITTYFITGECHEGWWAKKIGVNIGRFMQDGFKRQGREDLVYLGHEEADIELRTPSLEKKVRGPIVRLIHPGGGTAYALSYKTQKLAESLQGGEKPQVQFVGHYHKYDKHYHREIWNVMSACLCDQTIFMRKNSIPAHVGYLKVEAFVAKDGLISRFREEFVPFYDKGFYQKYETW